MKGVVLDDRLISQLFTQIEALIQQSRDQMDALELKYSSFDTHQNLVDSKDLLKLYGNVADDYSKLCFMMQGIVEAAMDVKSIKRTVATDSSNVVPAMVKSYKYRADNLVDQLTDLKEACMFAKSGMEARVRYLSSVSYSSYDKALGARC